MIQVGPGESRTDQIASASTSAPKISKTARPKAVPSMNGYNRTPTSWTTSRTADGWVMTLPHHPVGRARLIAATLCRDRLVTAGWRAVVFRRSRRTWKFGENPARSRHCVSLGSSQTCLHEFHRNGSP